MLSRLLRGRGAAAPAPAPARPLAAVEAAIATGATSRAEIAAATGLAGGTVDAAMAHLERTGRLARESLAAPCAAAGCAGCPSAAGGACATDAGGRRGPVALVLRPRPGGG